MPPPNCLDCSKCVLLKSTLNKYILKEAIKGIDLIEIWPRLQNLKLPRPAVDTFCSEI